MRLAWLTPWPPQSSGVAGRSAELVPRLAARGHAIDVFVDAAEVPAARASDAPPEPGQVRVQSVHDFLWRQLRGQYDLPVYQIGNSRVHEFVWPYAVRWPGLAVLHETRLHHARGRALLRRRLVDAYRAEFAWNEPHLSPELAELGVAGFNGVYYYQWPMRRAIVDTARLVAVHSRGEIDGLQEEFPSRAFEHIALGEGRTELSTASTRARVRRAYGLPGDAPVIGVFGGLTAEKRVPQVLRAFAATRASAPDARLLLVGASDPQVDLPELIHSLGLDAATILVSQARDTEFDDLIAACDISVNLRWPTAGETSGPWVRALAAGRATIVIDHLHQRHVPSLDPRSWARHAPTDDLAAGADERAVTVAIDILDEDHSLRLALRRLLVDGPLRARLGERARRFWEAEHTVERMADDYERAMARAVTLDAPAPPPLAHLTSDGSALTSDTLAPFGLALPW